MLLKRAPFTNPAGRCLAGRASLATGFALRITGFHAYHWHGLGSQSGLAVNCTVQLALAAWLFSVDTAAAILIDNLPFMMLNVLKLARFIGFETEQWTPPNASNGISSD